MNNTLLCPDCHSDDLLATEETIYNVNTEQYFCSAIPYTDSNAKVSCNYCGWEGIRGDLQAKIELEVVPTHWMDDRGLVASDKWLNGPNSNDDFRQSYNIPCIIVDNEIVTLRKNNS